MWRERDPAAITTASPCTSPLSVITRHVAPSSITSSTWTPRSGAGAPLLAAAAVIADSVAACGRVATNGKDASEPARTASNRIVVTVAAPTLACPSRTCRQAERMRSVTPEADIAVSAAEWMPIARDPAPGASRASSVMCSTPRRASSPPSSMPTGPAPMITTRMAHLSPGPSGPRVARTRNGAGGVTVHPRGTSRSSSATVYDRRIERSPSVRRKVPGATGRMPTA